MPGTPSPTPNVNNARQIAIGFNFTPVERQFFDQYDYPATIQVYTFAVGDKSINIQFLTEGYLP